MMEFPWWICFGTIVTFFVAILFRTGADNFEAGAHGVTRPTND